jgi:hypothetical protein
LGIGIDQHLSLHSSSYQQSMILYLKKTPLKGGVSSR